MRPRPAGLLISASLAFLLPSESSAACPPGMRDVGGGMCERPPAPAPAPAPDDDEDKPRPLTPEEKAFVDAVAQKGTKADPKDIDRAMSLLNTAVQYDSRPAKDADAGEKAQRIRNLQQWIKALDAILPLSDPVNHPRAIWTSDQGMVSLKTPVPSLPTPPPPVAAPPIETKKPVEPEPTPAPVVPPPVVAPPPPGGQLDVLPNGQPDDASAQPHANDDASPPPDETFKPGTVVKQGPDGQWQPDPAAPSAARSAARAKEAKEPSYDMSGAKASVADAAGMAGAMKSGLRQAEELPQGGGGRAPAQAARASPGSSAALNIAEPRSAQEFMLAATPYKDSFAALGLKSGGATGVLKKDGSPATPQDLDNLRARIRAEPAALRRDPAYLDPGRGGVSLDDFHALKDAYRRDGGLRATEFKHVELVPPGEDRDFKRSESCQIVSGTCNAHATKSYVKGDDVPAQDLNGIMAAIRRHLGAADDRRKSAAAGAHLSGIAARINGFLHGLGFSAGPDSAAAGSPSAESEAPSGAGADRTAGATAREVSARDEGGRGAPGEPGPAQAGGRGGSIAVGVFGVLGAALLAAAVMLRNRS